MPLISSASARISSREERSAATMSRSRDCMSRHDRWPALDKWTVARVLDEIAQYVALSDPNRFKSRAFERAARAVESLEQDSVRSSHRTSFCRPRNRKSSRRNHQGARRDRPVGLPHRAP